MGPFKSDLSRDDLGKLLIEITKEEIEQHGFVPESEILNPVFESKFGEHIKKIGLFDLGILMRRNEVIMEAAEIKQIENIVRLTKAFDAYLRTKKEEKEEKTQKFLVQRLGKIAA